jgi:histidinol-phosphate aminotransferase
MALQAYHGGKTHDEIRRRWGVRTIVKLASNENVLGPSPRALAVLRRAVGEAHLYPEIGYPALRKAIGVRFGLAPAQVVVGDGSNELLVLAANAYLRRGDEAVMATPSFSVFAHAVRGAGAKPVEVPLKDLRHDLPAMAKAVTRRTRLVIVCNPNNPTGTIVTRREVAAFLRALPAHLLVVFDEAYAEFAESREFPDSISLIRRDLRVMVVRTFAKLHGLAGLRVGYGLGPAGVMEPLERLRQPFNVNTLAARAALAALGDRAHLDRTLALVRAGRRKLGRGLEALGLRVIPSHTNFLLVDTGRRGRDVAEALERRGIIVRPLADPSLLHHIRITIGRPADHRRLLGALRSILYNAPS